MAKCDLCGKEMQGLRKCRDCSTTFCHWCMLAKNFHTADDEEVVEVRGLCPRCEGERLIEVRS